MPEFEKYPEETSEEAMERINKNIENIGLPESNAMDRTTTEENPADFYNIGGMVKPTVPSYKKGGLIGKAKLSKERDLDVKKIQQKIDLLKLQRQRNTKGLAAPPKNKHPQGKNNKKSMGTA